MSYSIVLSDGDRTVTLRYTQASSHEYQTGCDDMVHRMTATGYRRGLIDLTDSPNRLSFIQAFDTAVCLAKGLSARTSIAILYPSDPERLAADRFTEDVAFNRGLHMQLFSELEAAQAWLASDQALRH